MPKERTRDWVAEHQLDPSLIVLDEQLTLPKPLTALARMMGRWLVSCSEYASRAYNPACWAHRMLDPGMPNKPENEA